MPEGGGRGHKGDFAFLGGKVALDASGTLPSFLPLFGSSVGRGEREVEVKGSDSSGGWAGEGRRRSRASKRKIKAAKRRNN